MYISFTLSLIANAKQRKRLVEYRLKKTLTVKCIWFYEVYFCKMTFIRSMNKLSYILLFSNWNKKRSNQEPNIFPENSFNNFTAAIFKLFGQISFTDQVPPLTQELW